MGEPLYSLDWKSIRQGDLLDGRMTWQHGRCGDTDGVMVWCGRQLYKIEPLVFAAWMKVLKKVKNAKLWLLKFTEQGAQNLLKSAKKLKVDLLLCMPFLTMCYFWCTPVQAHARTHTRTHTYTHTHTHTHKHTHTFSHTHTRSPLQSLALALIPHWRCGAFLLQCSTPQLHKQVDPSRIVFHEQFPRCLAAAAARFVLECTAHACVACTLVLPCTRA